MSQARTIWNRSVADLFTGLLLLILLGTVALPLRATQAPGAYPSEAEGFGFLEGKWKIHHRWLKKAADGSEAWIEFEGRASFITLLDGLVSVEELRDAEGKPFGSAMRTFDREKRTWSDAWVSARDGVLQLPQHGRFVGDVGTFITPDTEDGKPILARGLWRRITKNEVTWEQALSRDDGKSWIDTWFMRFKRIEEKAKTTK